MNLPETGIFKKIAKLIDVKSIVTLTVTFTMVYVVVKSLKIDDGMFQLFSNILMLVFGFYFGKKDSGTDEQK